MSNDVRIPQNGFVLVSDGRKALFLKNHGDDLYPYLKVESVIQAPDNPQTHMHGTDKAGARGHHGAVAPTDWHDLAERKFAGEIAGTVNAACLRGDVRAIIVAAPPRTLAELRHRFSTAAKQRILAEINKDLTKHPIYEIEQYLVVSS